MPFRREEEITEISFCPQCSVVIVSSASSHQNHSRPEKNPDTRDGMSATHAFCCLPLGYSFERGMRAARMAIMAAPSTGVFSGGAIVTLGAAARITLRIGSSNQGAALDAPPVYPPRKPPSTLSSPPATAPATAGGGGGG